MPPKRKKNETALKDSGIDPNLRIDAITAEALHPKKYISITSPDKTLVLFYNTETLLRIGLEKGQMLQPPHFREPMTPALLAEVEQLEGKKIVLQTVTDRTIHNRRHHSGGGGVDDAADDVTEIVHRHAFFEQMINEIYLLHSADVYVCPACYQHWHDLHVAKQEEDLARLTEVRDVSVVLTERQRAVLRLRDPLDLLEQLDPETQLPFVAFRFAKHWKAHVKTHHGYTDHAVSEHRLRDVLCTYYSDYNGLVGQARPLTQQRFWAMNARFNTVRYNRIVERLEVEAAERSADLVTKLAFSDIPCEYEDERASKNATTTKKNRRKRRRDDDDDDDEESWLVEEEEEESWTPCFRQDDDEEEEDSSTSNHHKKGSEDRTVPRRPNDEDEDEESGSSTSASSSGDEQTPSANASSSYLKPHHQADRLTYEERQFLHVQLQKEERAHSKQLGSGTTSVRRPSRHVRRDKKQFFWKYQKDDGETDDEDSDDSDVGDFRDVDWATFGDEPLSMSAKKHKKSTSEESSGGGGVPSEPRALSLPQKQPDSSTKPTESSSSSPKKKSLLQVAVKQDKDEEESDLMLLTAASALPPLLPPPTTMTTTTAKKKRSKSRSTGRPTLFDEDTADESPSTPVPAAPVPQPTTTTTTTTSTTIAGSSLRPTLFDDDEDDEAPAAAAARLSVPLHAAASARVSSSLPSPPPPLPAPVKPQLRVTLMDEEE